MVPLPPLAFQGGTMVDGDTRIDPVFGDFSPVFGSMRGSPQTAPSLLYIAGGIALALYLSKRL